MMNIMIVDDHEVVRDGLALILKDGLEVETFLFASDGREAIQKATNFNIDLTLLDLSMPEGLDGLHTLIELRKLIPEGKIVIFSMYDEIDYQKRAYEYGADGFLVKQLKSEDLISSLQKILEGQKIFDEKVINQDTESEHTWDLPLSPREREVFILTVKGYTQKEVAEKMNISVKTVENHRQNISKKLGSKKKHDWHELAQKYNVFEIYK